MDAAFEVDDDGVSIDVKVTARSLEPAEVEALISQLQDSLANCADHGDRFECNESWAVEVQR